MSGFIDDIFSIYRVSVDPDKISSFDNRLIKKSRKVEQYRRYIGMKAIFQRKNWSCVWSVSTRAEEKKKSDKIADLSAIYQDILAILSKYHPFKNPRPLKFCFKFCIKVFLKFFLGAEE